MIADPARWYFHVVIKCCRGVILLRLLVGHGDDHSMSFSTKAGSLNPHSPMVQRLARASERSAVRKTESASHLDEGLPSYRIWQTDVLPLLMSCMGIGLVTTVLLLLDQSLAANLVPIAYLIP